VNFLAQPSRPERYIVRPDDHTASVDAAVFDFGGVLTTPVRDSISA
jgi:hypothetical protein